MRMRSPIIPILIAAMLCLATLGLIVAAHELADAGAPGSPSPDQRQAPEHEPRPSGSRAPDAREEVEPKRRRARHAKPEYRDSVAVGTPSAGRLVRGVMLPARGEDFFTWDPVRRTNPNRDWRRWGTDDVVRATLRIAREYRREHPRAPRMAVGDLSRPQGGDFGARFGPIGHASHQNGLDVDVYYPRRDRAERAPSTVAEVDLRLAQDLVDRFVAAGAVRVFVGPSLGLTGPPGVVAALPNHDNHLHARFSP